jgi:hypothetical protein
VATTGHEKERLTVTLAAYADGTKLPPLVHLPGVCPLPKNEVPNGVVVFMCGSRKKSWTNEESINFWLKRIWCLNNQKRRFLVWDAFRAHITPLNDLRIMSGEIASQDCLIHFRIKDLEGAHLLPPLVFSTGPENSHSSYISDKCDLNGLFHDTSAGCNFDVHPPQNEGDDDPLKDSTKRTSEWMRKF